jgi:hypothetical protein
LVLLYAIVAHVLTFVKSGNQSGTKDVQHTLKTLRYKLFAKAGCITTPGRRNILKLCVAMRQRQWLEGLWDRSKTFSLPVRFTPVFTPG